MNVKIEAYVDSSSWLYRRLERSEFFSFISGFNSYFARNEDFFPFSDGSSACVINDDFGGNLEDNVCFSAIKLQYLMAGPEYNSENTIHILLLISHV